MKTVNVVGQPVLVAGTVYKVDPSGQPDKNQFSNSAGYFRIVKAVDEMEKAGAAAAERLSKVFPCERKAD